MQIAAIGVGGAGGRIADQLYQDNQHCEVTCLGAACAVDTDTQALTQLTALPTDHRHSFGLSETDGTGTDKDRTSGVAAIERERLAVRRTIDPLITSDIDAIILIAGLAGGTGSAATPHIAGALAEIYTVPIYCLSVLPAGQDTGAAVNTIQAIQNLKPIVDVQILFDNHAWLGSGQTVEGAAQSLNKALVTRLNALFAAGETAKSQSVGQSVVDASEIINTLSNSDFATLGYATQELKADEETDRSSIIERFLSQFFTNESPDINKVEAYSAVETTLRRAARGKLTTECALDSADSALTVFAGPPAWLSRDAVADGQRWLADEVDSPEVRSGDMPIPDRSELSILVLFSGVTELPRLTELKTLSEKVN